MKKYIGPVTWLWIIIIGILMITPGGVVCIACGSILSIVLGVVTVALGTTALVVNRNSLARG